MRVVGWIPAGRARNLKILLPYLLRDKELFEKIYFCINTTNSDDIKFIHEICQQYPVIFDYIDIDQGRQPNGSKTVNFFYKHFTEAGVIYLKIDDDICFLQEGLLRELIQFRMNNKKYFLIYANLVNTVLCSHIHQYLGALNYRLGFYRWDAFCPVGWKSGEGAANTHECFLEALESDQLEKFLFPFLEVPEFTRMSINLICYFGEDAQFFTIFIENVDDDEEFLSRIMPHSQNRINVIYGHKIGAHFAYCTQREYLESMTILLEKYKQISQTVEYSFTQPE